MDRHTIIFVTDQRQQYISDFLPGRSCSGDVKNLGQMIRNANQVILPTPVMKIDKQQNIQKIIREYLVIEKEEDVIPHPMVFGGKFSDDWKAFFTKNEIEYVDFMEEEEVALENAQITAEATIAELLFHSKYSIRGEKFVITGYGRCAKAVAKKIVLLGGNVTILARSVRSRKEAKAEGYNAADFSYGPDEAYGTRAFINTVPAMVINENMIREMHKGTVIIDIASKPGGTDQKTAAKYQIPVIQALGLPGIYTPKSSAKILADSVIRHTLPEDVMREDKTWIFQIII